MIDEIAEHADTGAKVDDTSASSVEGEITGKVEGGKERSRRAVDVVRAFVGSFAGGGGILR